MSAINASKHTKSLLIVPKISIKQNFKHRNVKTKFMNEKSYKKKKKKQKKNK